MNKSAMRAMSLRHSVILAEQPDCGSDSDFGPGGRMTRAALASTDSRQPVATRLRVVHPRQDPPGLVWDDLDPVEQSLLGVASREHTLDHACASWTDRPGRRREIELTKAAARKLFNHDLIGFYRVDDGYPDLSDSDRSTIFRGITYWDKNHCDAAMVGIFLTTAGEEIVLGP